MTNDAQANLGGTVEVEAHLPPVPASIDLARLRGRSRRTIPSCTTCPLHQHTADGPVVATYPGGLAPAAYAVIGEAPGPEEDSKGRPFVGASGRLLKGALRKGGLDVEDGAYLNTASCIPKDERGRKFRAPKDEEQAACRGNLMLQLEASGARCVLLAGSRALNVFRPDLQVTHVSGYVFVWHLAWGDVMVMPVVHPAAVLRAKGHGGVADQFYTAVGLFGQLVEDAEGWTEGSGEWLDWLDDRCVRCGRYLHHIDPDGVGYCDEHWGRYEWSWKRAREKWGGQSSIEEVRLRGARRKPVRKGKNEDPSQGSLI